MAQVRLDKFVASALTLTRSEAHSLIRHKEINVDGKAESDISRKIDPEKAVVLFQGEALVYSEFHYYMLNKPDGFVCSTEDMRDRTITELFTKEQLYHKVFPVGRLDKDTFGLVILTDNGPLSHFLLSPKRHVDKKYYLESDKPLSESDVQAFLKGVDIGEKNITLPAKLEILSDAKKAYIAIHEGKFHQIKRMLEAVGKRVTYLERVEFDTIKLDPTLKRGQSRKLTSEEIRSLLKNDIK